MSPNGRMPGDIPTTAGDFHLEDVVLTLQDFIVRLSPKGLDVWPSARQPYQPWLRSLSWLTQTILSRARYCSVGQLIHAPIQLHLPARREACL